MREPDQAGRPAQVVAAALLLVTASAAGVAAATYAVGTRLPVFEFFAHYRYGLPLAFGVAISVASALALLRGWRWSRYLALAVCVPWPPDLIPSVERAQTELAYPAGLYLDWLSLVITLLIAWLLFSHPASSWFAKPQSLRRRR